MGLRIGATWRIRRNDLYGGGDAGCLYHYCISLFLLAPRYIAVTVQFDDILFFKYSYILAYSILVFRILEPCYRVLSGSLLPSAV